MLGQRIDFLMDIARLDHKRYAIIRVMVIFVDNITFIK